MTKPINVIIPTRERADTLHHALRTVVAQDCDRVKIWVSDNASSPATRDTVMAFDDPRIAYLNTGERLSMSHNYEFALSHVPDGWMVVIGDDDGLLPDGLVPLIEELEDSGLQALSSRTCQYNWPQAVPDEPTRLTVPLNKTVVHKNAKEAIKSVFRCDWHNLEMPQTYTGGIVDAELFHRLKAVRGSFFQSQIPDVYSGYAITGTVDEFLYSERPFALAGRSNHSIGTALFNMEKTAFLEEGLIPQHPDFPMPSFGTLSFSMAAMVCECYRQATYLHHDCAQISNQYMLELIMAETHFGRQQILEWGKQFAALHDLDYDKALEQVGKIDLRRKVIEYRMKADNLWRRARVYRGDPRPIANVMEAAQTAGAILRSPPNRVVEVVKSLKHRASAR